MALWLFTEAMLKGKAIQVFNHGNMRRDFTYVDDIVQGVKASLFAPSLNPYEVLNLGNHNAEQLKDMIGVLAATLGVEPKVEFLPMQPGDVEATYADISLAQAKLGFQPRTRITEGIPKFVAWYKKYHHLS
jgi:UDP-glucuronate 4-epimerase